MTILTILFIVFMLSLIYYSITLSKLKTNNQRLGIVVLVSVLCVSTYAALIDLMGRPRPAAFTSLVDEYHLLSYTSDKKWIYLWVLEPGKREPIALSVPFTSELGRKLSEAGKADRGAGLRIDPPSSSHHDTGEWIPHPTPHTDNPPKTSE
jgi:hypothetical protein